MDAINISSIYKNINQSESINFKYLCDNSCKYEIVYSENPFLIFAIIFILCVACVLKCCSFCYTDCHKHRSKSNSHILIDNDVT